MINFPVFQHFSVAGYGLYPGSEHKPGLSIDFKPGLTLVLGANGLGKTTLITMLYRVLSGGWELSKNTLSASELGGASLDVIRMNATERALFADRVQDLAVGAEATLQLTVGSKRLLIRRRLDNLGLISLQIDDGDLISDEETYTQLLPALCGVPTFGDWLLLLRHLVFYFEDRRSLVWDASSQRQILRMIFLPKDEAEAWYRQERKILQLDSNVRNLTAALNRLVKRIEHDDKASGNAAALRTQLKSLVKLQEKDEWDRERLVADADGLDSRRHTLRRELLSAEIEADGGRRRLETEKLAVLQRYFPSGQETTQYLYALLVSQNRCAVCSNEAPAAAKEIAERVSHIRCVVCGSQLIPDGGGGNVSSLDKERISKLRSEFIQNTRRVSGLTKSLDDTSGNYNTVVRHLIELKERIDDRSEEMRKIINALPSGDAKQAEAKQELSILRSKVAEDKATLAGLANEFVELIRSANARILERSEEVKRSFGGLADGFLFERAILKWAPSERSVGQLGLAKVMFPAFELDLSGTNFTTPTRRKGPDAVSESQREFIDLAFRMSLIHVAGSGIGGTLVLDAPESSLDAVFVKRAADVLCRFGDSDAGNRLVVTSNLIDGDLLPSLIKEGISPSQKEQRLVNLMEIAVPTAALRENQAAYAKEFTKILEAGGLS